MSCARFFTLLAAILLPVPVAQAADAPMHWYRCNTHTHTNAGRSNDVNASPAEAAAWYKAHGYQCLVITDHESMTDVTSLSTNGASGDFLVLPGEEITQTLADPTHPGGVRHAHVNAIGTKSAIMPVGYPDRPSGLPLTGIYRRNLAAIRADGGLPQVNHPNLFWSVTVDDLLPLDGPYLLEISNSYFTANNQGGDDGTGHAAPSTEQIWDRLLSAGRIVWGTATDDAHDYVHFDNRDAPTPGKGWIVVRAPSLTRQDVMDALHAGRFYASTGIWLHRYDVDAKGIALALARAPANDGKAPTPTRYVTRFIGADGRLLAEVAGETPRYMFRGNESYVRAVITDSDGKHAWTQPVFLDGRK